MGTKGMSSLNEDDVRRIFREELYKYETDLNHWLLSERIQALAIEADNANGGLIETHAAYQRRLDAKLLAKGHSVVNCGRLSNEREI